MKPLNLDPVDYILEKEREEENPTTFKLRPASGMERVDLGYLVKTDGEAAGIKATLKNHLVGWSNFGDVEFSEDMNSNIQLLGKDTIVELFNEVTRISSLDEEEVKN